MSKLILPEGHREILRKALIHILEQPSSRPSISALPGVTPSLRLGEDLIRTYKKRMQLEAVNNPTNTTEDTNNAHSLDGIPRLDTSANSTPSSDAVSTAPQELSPTQYLSRLHKNIGLCTECRLHQTRENAIAFPQKTPARIMVLLDIVNWGDQLAGRFFTTADGKLLLKILAAIKLTEKDIYVSTAIKCASTEEISNQLPTFAVCLKHLHQEIALVQPQWILAFGEDTYKLLTQKESFHEDITKQTPETPERFEGIPLTCTYHPRDLLRDPSLKKETWDHIRGLPPHIHPPQS